jgi:hypothetical protein
MPTSSAWRRRIWAATEWKVPSQRRPSASSPMMWVIRSRISRAALLVKVTTSISHGRARPVARMWARRVVSTRVLPVPAPASTSTGPSVASTAARCSGFSPSR